MRHYPHLVMRKLELSEEKLKHYDCAVIITDHYHYEYDWIVGNSKQGVDTRNATGNIRNSKIIKA